MFEFEMTLPTTRFVARGDAAGAAEDHAHAVGVHDVSRRT